MGKLSEKTCPYLIAATGTDPTQISTSSNGDDNIAQYRNLAIWLNDQPQTPFQFFLPKSAKLETKGGITFVRYEKTWLAIAPIHLNIEGINATATEKIRERYPNDQILTAVGTDEGFCGFALEVGEQEISGDFEHFKHSVLSRSHLNLDGALSRVATRRLRSEGRWLSI